jgi:hypothetical protein
MGTPARNRPVAAMTAAEKLGEAMRRSLPSLSPEARAQVESMLTPESLAIMAGVLTAWLASHAFGAGEIADAVMLVAGALALGWSVFSLAEELYRFASTAIGAKNENDLDQAAQHFARAVAIGGVTVVLSVLTRGAGRSLRGRVPRIAGPPPPGRGLFSKPGIVRNPHLPAGEGSTDAYGNIIISARGSLKDQQLVLLHEKVHQALSPRLRLFQELRADLGQHMYGRSQLLRYLEEALAETYAQLRVNGTAGLIRGLTFPLKGGYNLTAAGIGVEVRGVLLGVVAVDGVTYVVYVWAGGSPR